MPRVLIVDDHAFVRRGVQNIVDSFPDWELCGEASNGGDGVRMIEELRPDVVLMDVSMPGMDGIEATRAVRKGNSRIKIILITLHESVELLRSGFRAGANGYLLKADAEEELINALRIVIGDGCYISPKFDPQVVAQVLKEIQPASAKQPIGQISHRNDAEGP
ncbi:MAG TPA: response regulator transcription factor [Candidatus Eisenbacteria bacterium]|nr:response regulator transcription factor [Candidatus Eisenbacteria bacterium]